MDNSKTAMEWFEEALELHRAGHIAAAKDIYEELREAVGENPDLLRLLGTAQYQLGEYESALNLLNKTLEIDPSQADAFNNRGNLLRDMNRYEEALLSYDQAIALDPNYVDAWNNRGITLRHLKRMDEALACYDKAIALKTGAGAAQGVSAEAYNNRGNALHDLGRQAEALENFDKAIALRPEFAEAWSNRGNVLRALDRQEEALASYDKAMALRRAPDTAAEAELLTYRGQALVALKRFDEASACFERALALNPNDARIYNCRGDICFERKDMLAALADFDRAIALDPNLAEAYSNRGVILGQLKRHDEALACHDLALSIKPDSSELHFNRGNTLKQLDRADEALQEYEVALKLKPESTKAHLNRSNILRDTQHVEQAMQGIDDALALDPEFADGYWNKSVVKLLNGDFEEGWKLYEWRWKTEAFLGKARDMSSTLWLGQEDLRDRSILITPEQGLGDFIQFVRYTKILEAMGAQVMVEVPLAMIPLVESMQGSFSMIPFGTPEPMMDFHCPIMSLPLACGTTLETIPAEIPYVYADTDKRAIWRERLGPKTKPRVGLVWSGSTQHLNDHNRSIKLDHLAPLWGADVAFHCLQKEFRHGDLDKLAALPNMKLHHAELTDFAETAALIAELDLVISVDTSVAHVAGALGKPIWVMLPYAPDYRWLLHREDSPWYPGVMTLLRQQKPGDWSNVIDEARQRLDSLV